MGCGCGGSDKPAEWVVIKGGVEVYRGDQAGAQTYAVMNGGEAKRLD